MDELLIDALAATAARWADPDYSVRAEAVAATLAVNPGYSFASVTFAINQTMSTVTADALRDWQDGRRAAVPRRVGVLHAGNIPMGELQDVLAVLLAGHAYRGVVSSRSPHLLPGFARDLLHALPRLDLAFTDFDALFTTAEAVIATGSDETREAVAARCEAAGIPDAMRLLRGHRYGVAVVDGKESQGERERLAEDVLLHEGHGCRNVALVWAPKGQAPDLYLEAFAEGRAVYPAPEATEAQLKMPLAFLRATKQPHAALEDGSLIVSRGTPEVQGPGHLRWSEYDTIEEVHTWLAEHVDRLQVVAASPRLKSRLRQSVPVVTLGDTQRPPLDWHPDGTDTLGWLATR